VLTRNLLTYLLTYLISLSENIAKSLRGAAFLTHTVDGTNIYFEYMHRNMN